MLQEAWGLSVVVVLVPRCLAGTLQHTNSMDGYRVLYTLKHKPLDSLLTFTMIRRHCRVETQGSTGTELGVLGDIGVFGFLGL